VLLSDENLVTMSQVGDNEAFAQLVRKYSQDAYRTAFMVLRDRDEVEDVVQESFLTCYRKIKSFRMESSFKTWMYRIVVSRCYDRLRKLNRENATLNKITLNSNNENGVINGLESRLDLREVILGLKPEHRLVLTLYYGMDFSVQKVADILGVPAGTVKSRLNSARGLIKKSMTVNPL
jgi:RNA polymerase sigma-70 factor (ECF subfamily)